jgi:PPOX class probable F420-dependent enzyme
VPSKHVLSRLKKDHVIWFVTATRDGRPRAVPVWFWWDGRSFLIYSVSGQKVRDVKANQHVALHLDTDPEGDDVIRIDAIAKVSRREPPAYRVAPYVRKYREQIKGFGWTPKQFSDDYHVAIRVRPTRFH